MSVQRFVASINQWLDKVEGRLDKVVQGVSLVCAENMIVGGDYSPGTPVDTGFARASWWIRIDSPERPDPGPINSKFGNGGPNTVNLLNGGFAVLEGGTITLLGAKAGDTVYIMNDAEYIDSLEFGHSGQAPAGFMRVTLAHAQEILDKVVLRVAHE